MDYNLKFIEEAAGKYFPQDNLYIEENLEQLASTVSLVVKNFEAYFSINLCNNRQLHDTRCGLKSIKSKFFFSNVLSLPWNIYVE